MTRGIQRRDLLRHSAVTLGALGVAPLASFGAGPAMSFEEYRSRDGLALAGLVRKGEVSAAELLEIAAKEKRDRAGKK